MTLDFDTVPFSYFACDRFGNPIVALYGPPATQANKPGTLAEMLRKAQAFFPDVEIHSVIWMPAHLPFYPRTFFMH